MSRLDSNIPREVRIIEDYYGGSPNIIGLTASSFGIVGGPGYNLSTNYPPDSTAGFDLLAQFIESAQFLSEHRFEITFLPGPYVTRRFPLPLPTPGYGTTIRLLGAGASVHGTVIATPKTPWTPDENDGPAFMTVSGIGSQVGTFFIDGFLLYNYQVTGVSSAPSFMYGYFQCIQVDPSLSYGIAENFSVGELAAWNFVPGQMWIKGSQTSYGNPAQFGRYRKLWPLPSGALNTGASILKVTGDVGPVVVDWIIADAVSALDDTAIVGTYVGLDRRTGLAITSIDSVTGIITFAQPHFGLTGDGISFPTASGTAWYSFSLDTQYFLVPVTGRTAKLASTLSNANIGVAITGLTGSAGTSTISINAAGFAVATNVASPQLMIGNIHSDYTDAMIHCEFGYVEVHDMYGEEINCAIRCNGSTNVDGEVNFTGQGRLVASNSLHAPKNTVCFDSVNNGRISFPDNIRAISFERVTKGKYVRRTGKRTSQDSLYAVSTIGFTTSAPTTTGDFTSASANVLNISSAAAVAMPVGLWLQDAGVNISASPLTQVQKIFASSAAVAAAGSGYAVNNVITLTDGSTWTVASISGSGVATVTPLEVDVGVRSAPQANPVAQSSVSPAGGSGCTLNLTYTLVMSQTATGTANGATFTYGGQYSLLGDDPFATALAPVSGVIAVGSEVNRWINLPATEKAGTNNALIRGITAFADPGDWIGLRIASNPSDGTLTFINFAAVGNGSSSGIYSDITTGSVLRLPRGARVQLAPVQQYGHNAMWQVLSIRMPVHTDSWTPGSVLTLGNTSHAVTTCYGAKAGDPMPVIIPPGSLGGLISWGNVTADDTVTIYIFNPTTGSITGPAGTWGVQQIR